MDATAKAVKAPPYAALNSGTAGPSSLASKSNLGASRPGQRNVHELDHQNKVDRADD